MKTVSVELKNHLEQTVTTLATLWKIVRTDSREFYFTDHDKDVTFNGNIYKSTGGYSRSAISNSLGLSVDNLEVQGVFEGDQIQEEEIIAGLFDYADIFISAVNWVDLTQGELKLRRGKFGEVVSDPRGFYTTELRGMSQLLSQNILTLYTPECRVDLGSPKCGIPILPSVLGRSQAVLVGEFYRVPTKSLLGVDWVDVIRNGGFELDPADFSAPVITGWTMLLGTWQLRGTTLGIPFAGALFLNGGNASSGSLEQIIDIDKLGLLPAEIDAGNVTADFSGRRANHTATLDLGRILVQFQDANGLVIGTGLDTGLEAITPEDTWVLRSFTGTVLPSGTRKIRVALAYVNVSGGDANTAFDGLSLTLHETARTNTFHDIYENRVYEVTTAGTTAATQPSYSTIIGNPTVDGTATLTARDSFTRDGHIQEVIDDKTLTIAVSEARAIDGWFDQGALIMESSQNAGKAIEIKSWTQVPSQLGLYLIPPFFPQSGAKVRLYAGCDKRIGTCVNKFSNVVNFRGEPFIPGADSLNSFADVR